MLKTKISDDERYALQQYNRTTTLELIRLKCFSVLIADQGLSGTAVAEVVGKSIRTVNRWLQDWDNRRMASIFSGHGGNHNAAKLTPGQRQEIKHALSQPPSDYGIPKQLWDVPALKDYVSATFGVVYESPESYYFLLRFAGLSFKYPDTFDRKRNEELILERMQHIRAELRPLLCDDDWEVFAADEVKMQQDAIIRKAWLKKGERTLVKVDRDKQSQSYIGFLNQTSHRCHLYEMAWQNSDEVLRAITQLLGAYPDKRLAIIWDNAPFHKSKRIREELGASGVLERVYLIAMPPYAPDENPIEHVWNTAKQAVANIQRNTFQETKQAFSDFVASRLFRYSF